jgi:hypothetical protein
VAFYAILVILAPFLSFLVVRTTIIYNSPEFQAKRAQAQAARAQAQAAEEARYEAAPLAELNKWLAENVRRYTEAEKTQVRKCMAESHYYSLPDCVWVDSNAELDTRIHEDEIKDNLAQERLDEARREYHDSTRQICGDDPDYRAHNPATCSSQ